MTTLAIGDGAFQLSLTFKWKPRYPEKYIEAFMRIKLEEIYMQPPQFIYYLIECSKIEN